MGVVRERNAKEGGQVLQGFSVFRDGLRTLVLGLCNRRAACFGEIVNPLAQVLTPLLLTSSVARSQLLSLLSLTDN